MNNLVCFVAVEFVDDPKVAGWTYWYFCPIDGAEVGDEVIAPLGRHDHIQKGVIRKVKYDEEENAPYPMHSIKKIKILNKAENNVQDSK
ncbi:MAG: hypothetical protein K2K38_04380 [Clostridia bacterium]|nr:hypothetical protein [Clostridia bacterium]